jgi:hypothetical protein
MTLASFFCGLASRLSGCMKLFSHTLGGSQRCLALASDGVSASFSDGPLRADGNTDELASAFVIDFTDPMTRPGGLPYDGSQDARFHV